LWLQRSKPVQTGLQPANIPFIVPALITWSSGQMALLARTPLAYDSDGMNGRPPTCEPLHALRTCILERRGVAAATLACSVKALHHYTDDTTDGGSSGAQDAEASDVESSGGARAGKFGAAQAGLPAGQQFAVPQELLLEVEQALLSHGVIERQDSESQTSTGRPRDSDSPEDQ
jgi:hypothetical protein